MKCEHKVTGAAGGLRHRDGDDIAVLAQRLGDAVIVDEATGLRAIAAETCRRHLDGIAAARQAERDRLRAEMERAKANDPVRELRRKLRARSEAQRQPGGGDTPALAHLLAAEHEARPLDEMAAPRQAARCSTTQFAAEKTDNKQCLPSLTAPCSCRGCRAGGRTPHRRRRKRRPTMDRRCGPRPHRRYRRRSCRRRYPHSGRTPVVANRDGRR